MLDFRPKGGRSKNYYRRHEQRKLLLLVLSVGMVLFLIEQAANPRRWLWIWQAAGQQAANDKAERHAKVEQPAELRRNLAPGEFIAEGEHSEELPADKQFLPGVDRTLLARVRDDTAFRSTEMDAFYHLLQILNETDEQVLEKASIGAVSFNQLFNQPKEFRGDLVNISGTARRVLEKKLPRNSSGVERYYEVVIEPDDRAYPVVIYSLDLPDGFRKGEKLNETIRLTGFFYKRWPGMSAKREIMSWPLLLSKTVRWQPAAVAAPPADGNAKLKSLTSGLALAIVASLAVMLLLFLGTRRKTRFVMPQANRDELQRLADQEAAPDVREQLAELARHENP